MRKALILLFAILFFNSFVSGAQIFYDDFESGTLSGWNLTNAAGANNWTSSTTNPYQGTWHAQSQPLSTTQPASILGKEINTAGYQNITLNYARRLVGIDAADEFNLTWYNGTSWFVLENTGGSSANDAGYINRSYNLSISASGNLAFKIRFECTAGATSEFCRIDNVNISGIQISTDTEYPKIIDFGENPVNNTAYVANAYYFFNTTIISTNGTAGLEFNGVNYTALNISSSFNATVFNLAAGTYSYYWWAYGNGTSHNYNKTGTRYYTVAKANGNISLLINGSAGNQTDAYLTQTNVSAATLYGTISLYRNGADITSQNNIFTILGAGDWNFSALSSGDQNHSAISLTKWAHIVKASQAAILTLNETSPIIYGILINVSCNGELYRNNTNITTEKSLAKLLGGGQWLYSCKLYENQNYSYDDDNSTLIVNQATQSLTALLNGANANLVITYPQQINASFSGANGTAVLSNINGTSVNIGQNYTFGAGGYVVNYTAVANQNYSAFFAELNLTINKAMSEVFMYLNNTRSSLNLTIGGTININATLQAGESIIQIIRNGTVINSGNSPLFNLTTFNEPGYFNYTVFYPATQNYTTFSETFFVNVTGAVDTILPYFTTIPLDLIINYSDSFGVSFNATDEILFDSYKINWTNTFSINQSGFLRNTSSLAVGTYRVNVSINDSSNNINSTIYTLIVQRKAVICTISSNSPQEYPKPINVTGSCNSPESISLYRNNINITSELGANKILGAGTYNYLINVTQTQNYTNASASLSVAVSQNSSYVLSVAISPSNNVVYPTSTTAVGNGCLTELSCILYRNNISQTNPEVIILGTGNYSYIYNTSGNANYTSKSFSAMLTVNQNISSSVSLYLNNTQNNITMEKGSAIWINGTLDIGIGAIRLYNNGTLVNEGINFLANYTLFNATEGLFNITLIYNGNENYSGTSKALYVNITPMPDTSSPIISVNSPQQNQFINVNSVVFNITLNENGDARYTLNEGITNLTMSSTDNKNFNHTNTSIADGTYTVQFYANDSVGNNNNSVTRIFTIDTTKPWINISEPQNKSYNLNSLQINFSAFDTNLQACWYSKNWQTNISLVNCQNVSYTASQGATTLIVYANDSAGNINSSSVAFFVDSIIPQISFGFGTTANGTTLSYNYIFINVSAIESNFANITFSLHNLTSLVNITTFTLPIFTINFTSLLDGTYFYNVTITDNLNNKNSTETRTIVVDTAIPTITIISPIEKTYKNSSILVNITSNGQSIWFYNGTANETYTFPVYRPFQEGTRQLLAYANNSAGTINSASAIFQINTLVLSCEVGGPYQQGALVLVQGILRNETSSINQQQINLSIYKNNIFNTSKIADTSSDGSFESSFSNLSNGNFLLNASVIRNGLNESCSDNFELGSPASFVLDKIATIYNLSSAEILYNITLRLINKGGADALNTSILDLDSINSPYNLNTLLSNTNNEVSYLLNLTRENITSYYLTSKAIAQGIDSYTNFLIMTNSTTINLTIPAAAFGKQIIIIKNILFLLETPLNITYNITSTLYNSGGENLININYIDSDISASALLINITRGSSEHFSNVLTIQKAASNIEYEFALGSAVVDLLSFYSNRPKINIPGYGGPADVIVYAPSSVTGTLFDSIIKIININLDIGQDFTINYWITNNDETINYTSGQRTVFVSANSPLNVSVTLNSPITPGTYKLKAFVSWAGGIATSFDSFEVISGAETPSGGGSDIVSPAPKPSQKQAIKEKEGEKEIVCNIPYIRHGEECCLDENNNLICDNDEIKEPEQPANILTLITGLIVNNTVNINIIGRFFILILNILIFIFTSILIIHLIRKRKMKRDTTRLGEIIGLSVYSSDGMKIGILEDIFIKGNKIDSLKIKCYEKKKFKLKGIVINYNYIESIKDIIIIKEGINEKIQNL